MTEKDFLAELTADIVAAHVGNNTIAVGDLPTLIQNVHGALYGLSKPAGEGQQEKTPAVSVRASARPDYIICMECGQKRKTLRRHLQTAHGMTPEQYRRDYGLPNTYPMVAQNYSERRREVAKEMGLGRKPRAKRRKRKPNKQG